MGCKRCRNKKNTKWVLNHVNFQNINYHKPKGSKTCFRKFKSTKIRSEKKKVRQIDRYYII